MKKLALIIAAMFTMAQMSAATDDAAVNNEAAPAVEASTIAAEDDGESLYQHPFKDNDESTSHWSLTTSGFYFGMGVSHSLDLINNSFEIGLLNIAAVNYNSLHGQNISLGVGIHHRSYSFKRPNMLYREDNGSKVDVTTYPEDNIDKIKNRSSNLNMWAVQFPLMFTQKIVKKLDITVAGIMNWNTYARVDNHYELDKVEYDTKFKNLKQNKVSFDFMGALSWDEFGIYCRYTPGKFFKEGYGPEIKNTWTLGITLGL
jgi:opacity protein-like surface antigen